jgi:hypothetical protein
LRRDEVADPYRILEPLFPDAVADIRTLDREPVAA